MDVRIAEGEGAVFVQLSERNLRDLAAQFRDTRAQGRAPSADLRRLCNGTMLYVEVVADDAHYKDERRPGFGSGLIAQPDELDAFIVGEAHEPTREELEDIFRPEEPRGDWDRGD